MNLELRVQRVTQLFKALQRATKSYCTLLYTKEGFKYVLSAVEKRQEFLKKLVCTLNMIDHSCMIDLLLFAAKGCSVLSLPVVDSEQFSVVISFIPHAKIKQLERLMYIVHAVHSG